MLFYYISTSIKIQNYFIKRFGTNHNSAYRITFNRLFAILIYGIIPFFILFFDENNKLIEFGLNFKNSKIGGIWILILCSILVLINYLNRKNSDNIKLYPQIREKKWTIKLIIISALGWTLYIFAYEFMFRGFLLFSCFYAFGIWPAIIINIGIYSLTHVPKGMKEAIGAIPLGLVLCLLTLKSGSIFAAFIIHITMALSNEWFTLSIHPDIHLIRKKIS